MKVLGSPVVLVSRVSLSLAPIGGGRDVLGSPLARLTIIPHPAGQYWPLIIWPPPPGPADSQNFSESENISPPERNYQKNPAFLTLWAGKTVGVPHNDVVICRHWIVPQPYAFYKWDQLGGGNSLTVLTIECGGGVSVECDPAKECFPVLVVTRLEISPNCMRRHVLIHKMTRKQVMDDS